MQAVNLTGAMPYSIEKADECFRRLRNLMQTNQDWELDFESANGTVELTVGVKLAPPAGEKAAPTAQSQAPKKPKP